MLFYALIKFIHQFYSLFLSLSVSLGDRLNEGLDTSILKSSGSSFGGKEIVFKIGKVKILKCGSVLSCFVLRCSYARFVKLRSPCDFLLLIDVNEQISYGSSNKSTYTSELS